MKLWNAKADGSVSAAFPRKRTIALGRIDRGWPNTLSQGVALSIFLSAVIYLPPLTWTFGHDQNVFAEIGSLILKGKLPYINAWDIKPPNIYYLYALAEWIFGRHEFAIRILDYLSSLATSALLFLYVARAGRDDKYTVRFAILAPVLFAWITLALGLADTAQTESFSLPLIAGAMLAWQYNDRPRYAIFAGALLAVAAFFKTTNILLAVPFFFDAIIFRKQEHQKKSWMFFVLGIALMSLLEILFMLWQGFLGEYLKIAESVLTLHGLEQTGSPITLGSIVRILLLYAGAFAFSAAIGLWILFFGKNADQTGRSKARSAIGFTLSLLAFAIAAVVVQRKGWGYQYVIVLPALVALLTLSTGEFFRSIARWCQRKSARFGRYAVGLLTLLMLVVQPMNKRRVVSFEVAAHALTNRPHYLASMGSPRGIYYPPYTVALAKYLDEHTTTRDSIFILGQEPGAYWKADRIPSTRYIYTLLFTSPMMTDARFRELNQTLLRHPPTLIAVEQFDTLAFSGVPMTSEMLLQAPHLRDLHNLIEADYVLQDTVLENFLIYRRKS